ncbi:hypothetical protein [Paucisalibacillus sp. EB02]|uniref:hypothetical protein n=1 Tax=Paucisalibacillus sp. EB02 TaxID=1347087 RepID=UPI0004B9B017|nr:hypothetical protein [Paucisalibacillus sp. EB02]
MKKTIVNIFIILFLISVYKDLTFGTDISTKNKIVDNPTENMDELPFDVIKVKINAGDTVLTVMEKLNPTWSNLNIEQILQDFSSLNPNINPNHLQQNHFYFFPKYHH